MQDRDPNIVISGLSRTVTRDGITVEVNICRLEHESRWVLEVISEKGTSTVWDDLFDTDDEALMAFMLVVEEEWTCNGFVPVT